MESFICDRCDLAILGKGDNSVIIDIPERLTNEVIRVSGTTLVSIMIASEIVPHLTLLAKPRLCQDCKIDLALIAIAKVRPGLKRHLHSPECEHKV